jgi:hypothetical protein
MRTGCMLHLRKYAELPDWAVAPLPPPAGELKAALQALQQLPPVARYRVVAAACCSYPPPSAPPPVQPPRPPQQQQQPSAGSAVSQQQPLQQQFGQEGASTAATGSKPRKRTADADRSGGWGFGGDEDDEDDDSDGSDGGAGRATPHLPHVGSNLPGEDHVSAWQQQQQQQQQQQDEAAATSAAAATAPMVVPRPPCMWLLLQPAPGDDSSSSAANGQQLPCLAVPLHIDSELPNFLIAPSAYDASVRRSWLPNDRCSMLVRRTQVGTQGRSALA